MDRIGKYVVHKVVLTTGYARIFLCHDPDLQVPVAVKVFDPRAGIAGPLSPAQLLARFTVEARSLASFDHPYIVSVKAMEHLDDGRPYFVMPFQAAHLSYEIGKDFADADAPERDQPRKVALPRALGLVKQLASALNALHRRGMVHRAVMPSNILLTAKEGGVVKLADFSMVKLPERNPPLPDHWIGGTEYCAPEQRENATGVGPQADVYSLGVLAYRLVTGGLPDTTIGAVELPDGPAELAELIRACTDPDPARRPAHGGAVLEAVAGVPVPAARKPVQVVTLKKPMPKPVKATA
ncbi:MAG TPA: serine/threonine-protein kinase [Candidatus Omnitrophota bacterium]|nr:serine/threonine-protein kinase [Candidatus Omnitrophota bacterium]